mmetsp:Transcript_98877/g.308100  ORF Transcript_98877/g.308100 Transcript_98877/m.308100 type:complete len:363 (-) Transcript_98877:357-1445(-)
MHSPRLKKLCWTLPGLCRICRGGSNDCKWSLVKGGSPNPIQSAKARQGKKLCPHTDNSSLMVLQGLGAHVCLLDRGVVRVHLGLRAEAHERHAIVQRLGVDRGAGHAREVQADLLDERPFVVHAPLGVVLPLACFRVALHERLHQASPPRELASRRAIPGRPHVGAGEDVGHRALVPVDVVPLADAVGDVDADVRECAHLREDRLAEGLLPDHAAPPRASIHVVLMKVLLDGGINVATRIPDRVRTLDDEAARVEGLRPTRDRDLRNQAGVVQRRGHHVGHRDLRRRHRQGIGHRACGRGRRRRRRRRLCTEAAKEKRRRGSPDHGTASQGKRHCHGVLEEVLPSALLLEALQAAGQVRDVG